MSYSMSDLLQLMVSEGAADLHIRVGIPPVIRLHGVLHRVEGPSLRPEDTEELMRSITSEDHIQHVRERGGADFGRGQFAVLEQHERRNAANTITRRRLLVGVDIHFADLDLAGVLGGDLLEDRRNHLAGAAPGCPVVDENGLVGLQDVGFEAIIGDVLDAFGHGFFLSAVAGKRIGQDVNTNSAGENVA